MESMRDDDFDRERKLDRDGEREPSYLRAKPLPRRNLCVRARLADICSTAGELQPPVKP